MIIRDIYIRNPEDYNYKYGILDHNDVIEAIVAKIKVILNTTQGKVLGDVNFGVGIEDLVFETKINKTEIEEKIKKQISQYITEASEYKITPKVSFGQSENIDFCLIDIYINDVKTAGILIK
jgi:hypothetical protein